MVDHPVPSIVETSYYPLLNKDETPFSVYWYDRYPEIMRPNSQQAAPSRPRSARPRKLRLRTANKAPSTFFSSHFLFNRNHPWLIHDKSSH